MRPCCLLRWLIHLSHLTDLLDREPPFFLKKQKTKKTRILRVIGENWVTGEEGKESMLEM